MIVYSALFGVCCSCVLLNVLIAKEVYKVYE